MTDSPRYRLPPDLGVIEHPSLRMIVVYRVLPNDGIQAHELGRPQLLDLTEQLRTAIEADLEKRGLTAGSAAIPDSAPDQPAAPPDPHQIRDALRSPPARP